MLASSDTVCSGTASAMLSACIWRLRQGLAGVCSAQTAHAFQYLLHTRMRECTNAQEMKEGIPSIKWVHQHRMWWLHSRKGRMQ